MLNCTVCGHDNLPITDASIYGFAAGRSLQIVERCHKCGARVTEKCLICCHLHPLGTTHCSLSGIKVQDFIDQRADADTRLEAFANSDGYNEIIWWRKLAGKLFLGIDLLLVVAAIAFVYGYGNTLSGQEFENLIINIVFLSLLIGLVVVFLEIVFYQEYFDLRIRKLWHKMRNREQLVLFWGELKVQDAELTSLLEQKVRG